MRFLGFAVLTSAVLALSAVELLAPVPAADQRAPPMARGCFSAAWMQNRERGLAPC